MDLQVTESLAVVALAFIVLRFGWVVHRRSVAEKAVHGGALSLIFSFLSGLCFVAILPTVCMSVLVLHPEAAVVAGLTWHPILAIVVVLGAGSLIFALLHALFERAPMLRALEAEAAREARGWTEEDARRSGL